MRLTLDLDWMLTTLLASIRVAMVFALTPLLTFARLPASVRTWFVLGLTAVLVAGLSASGLARVDSLGGLAAAAAGEALIGALLAFGLLAVFAAFQLAGRVLDLQLGFGVAALIDPNTRAATPLLGTLLGMAAVFAFFAIDGHHLVIRGLAFSFEQVPPGTPPAQFELAPVVAMFGAMFSFAAAIAAPVIVLLLLVDVALSVMARTMPQMNIFFLSLPLKILIGLATLALSVQYLAPVVRRSFTAIFEYWQQVLGG
jgi:flagellar biosynthetic protein FliR